MKKYLIRGFWLLFATIFFCYSYNKIYFFGINDTSELEDPSRTIRMINQTNNGSIGSSGKHDKAIRRSYQEKEITFKPDEEEKAIYNEFSSFEPKRVLIVSYWRSGSSWVGKLLSQTKNSFYVFEPLHSIRMFPSAEPEIHIGYKGFTLQELFHCGISNTFLTHLNKFPSLYQNPNCHESCNSGQVITEDCLSSDMIVIKTTRLLLSEVETFFMKPSMNNLKVIFLVRDPRGTKNSLYKHEEIMIQHYENVCATLRENVYFYNVLKSLFPNQIYFLRYEDIARNSTEKSLEIWNFVNSFTQEENIPEEWSSFLEESWRKKGDAASMIGSFKTSLKSSQDWQVWRTVISEKLLKSTEDECGDVINLLGYRKFGSIKKTRDLSISVLAVDDCHKIPC